MHEAVLRDYFAGTAEIGALRTDLEVAVTQTSHDVLSQHIVYMDTDFEITTAHLIRLCDAVLAAHLPPLELSVIAFCLIASERFHWNTDVPDGGLIEATLHDWDSPEINYPLNRHTVAKYRHRLVTGEDIFTRADER